MKLVLSLALTLLVGFIAGFATARSIDTWYANLNKPSFNPPNWLFAPVWTILYILMGIALYIVWNKTATSQRNIALTVFLVQLAINFAWSFIFFNSHQVGWALVDIIVLWFLILVTIILFFQISSTAGWLLVPYLLWVSFAGILNYSIWQLNK